MEIVYDTQNQQVDFLNPQARNIVGSSVFFVKEDVSKRACLLIDTPEVS
jgi:hypothetical protein